MDLVRQQLTTAEAHNLLTRVVAQMINEGRSTKAAGLKPRLMIASGDAFRERDLGFETFRAFLEDAARQQVVTVREVPGPDLEVGLTWVDPAIPRPRRIRHDVYVAFAEWAEGCQAVWDRVARKAYRFPLIGGDLEVAALQQRVMANPHSFAAIQPLEADDVLGWMREFADEQRSLDVRTLLHEALSRERPLQAFVRMTTSCGAQDAWTSYRLGRLRHHIEEWAAANAVELDSTVFAAEHPSAAFRRTPTGAADSSLRAPHARVTATAPAPADVLRLREFVKAAVDRMTLAELAALPIAAHHYLED